MEILAQNALTLLIGLELRNMFYSETDNMSAPYGLSFAWALFQQPGYYEKIKQFQNLIIEELFPGTAPSS